MPGELPSKISEEDLKTIGETIAGKGRFGPLLNSTVDLDNIDNVFRLAYHIGLVKSGKVPLKLAKSLWIENGKLVLKKETIYLVEEWHKIRKKLYLLLLRNPEEFSAKCMLSEAIELAKAKEFPSFNWHDVDYELLQKLSKVSSETSMIISRFMKGILYGCIGIFSTAKTDKYKIFIDTSRRRKFEDELTRMIRLKFSPRFKSAMVALHQIIDINKTERQVCIQTDDSRAVKIGKSSNKLLIGVFLKNVNLNIYKIKNIPNDIMHKIRQEICRYLSNIFKDPDLHEVELYGEINECE